MQHSSRIAIGFALLAFCLVPGTAGAGTTVHEAAITLQPTNWSMSIDIPKHDLAEGCLDSVCVELVGHVEGSAKFESLDASPATVTMDLAATITLQRPDLSTLVVAIPVSSTSDNVTAFDGVIDFAGTSGKTYPNLMGDKTENACTSSGSDIALFTGAGTITLPIKADGTSTGSGAGNLVLQFATSASAIARITYYWSLCPLPAEEATWGKIKMQYLGD